jgi:hypothetical protein
MEGSSDLNILAYAQKEYMEELNTVLVPFLLASFEEMYNRSVIDSKGKNVLLKFQQYLRDVKSWNQGMVKQHADEVTKSCSFLKDLIAAVFVGKVKILSSIRLNEVKKKIPLRLPKCEDFIYMIYEENAQNIYKDPYWLQEDITDDEKVDKITEINRICLEKVVKKLVPTQKILEAYMSHQSAPQEDVDVESHLGSDTEDPEIADSGDENEELPPPPEELPGETPPETPEVPTPGDGEEILQEIKNIQVPPHRGMPEEEPGAEEDDVLMQDAADTRNIIKE